MNRFKDVVRVIGLGEVEKFARVHSDAAKRLSVWIEEVREATWTKPADILERYPRATVRGENARFEIGQNYRLLVKVNYRSQIVRVAFIGAHDDYDWIDFTRL